MHTLATYNDNLLNNNQYMNKFRYNVQYLFVLTKHKLYRYLIINFPDNFSDSLDLKKYIPEE